MGEILPSSALFLLFAAVAIAVLQLADIRRLAAWRGLLVLLVFTVSGAVLIKRLDAGTDRFATTQLSQRAEFAAQAFSGLGPDRTVLIAVGASRTHFGLRRAELEKALAESGIDVAVIKLTVPGADHFQRLEMLRRFTRRVRDLGRPMPRRLIAMFEVQKNYDTVPLTLWRALRQAWSPEALESTQAHNGPVLLGSYVSSSQIRDPETFVQLLAHLATNAAGGGKLAPQVPEHKQKTRGPPKRLIDPPALASRRPGGARLVRRQLAGFEAQLAAIESEPAASTNGWKRRYVDPLLREALPMEPANVVYFNVPSIKPGDYRHARGWCSAVAPQPCIYFGLAQWRRESGYAKQDNWRDPGHMLAPLAETWTAYIAGELGSPDGLLSEHAR